MLGRDAGGRPGAVWVTRSSRPAPGPRCGPTTSGPGSGRPVAHHRPGGHDTAHPAAHRRHPVAHEAGLDATREQLGHSDPSVTYQRYVATRRVAPDLRPVLDQFFLAESASSPEDDAPRPGSSGGFTGVSTGSTGQGERRKPLTRISAGQGPSVEPPVRIELTT